MLARHVVGACAMVHFRMACVRRPRQSLIARGVPQTPPTIASVICSQQVLLILYGLWSGFMEAPRSGGGRTGRAAALASLHFSRRPVRRASSVCCCPPRKGWSSAALAWASLSSTTSIASIYRSIATAAFSYQRPCSGLRTYAFCASHSLWSAVLTIAPGCGSRLWWASESRAVHTQEARDGTTAAAVTRPSDHASASHSCAITPVW